MSSLKPKEHDKNDIWVNYCEEKEGKGRLTRRSQTITEAISGEKEHSAERWTGLAVQRTWVLKCAGKQRKYLFNETEIKNIKS